MRCAGRKHKNIKRQDIVAHLHCLLFDIDAGDGLHDHTNVRVVSKSGYGIGEAISAGERPAVAT